MNLYVIPTSSQNPHYTQVVTLSNVPYTLEIRFNTRMNRWLMTVADSGGKVIVAGIVLLTLRNLVAQYTTLAVPPGILFCLNAADPTSQPGLSSFLTDTQFLYNDPVS